MSKPIHRDEYLVVRTLIRELRLETGTRQADLSAALGKPQPYISAIETGQRRVDIIEVRDICKTLGLTLPEFILRMESAIAAPKQPGVRKRTRIG